ncbi:cytosol aminopeptidase-like [Teleopsis dalmanni]|uniref:cytosol aminopeptidase-like n=1 Tax=Teleopsis dalmanni TaxID=139649 RepID=UPI0018CFA2BE|nr:cytosol aminopeptidase-like [Teleopsis dalmanni]
MALPLSSQYLKILEKDLCRRANHCIWKQFASTLSDNKIIKGLVLGVYEGEGDAEPKLSATAEKFNDRVNGKIMDLIRAWNITGAVGKGKVFNNIDPEFRSIALVGVGAQNVGFNEMEMIDEGMENVRIAAGVGARSLQYQGCSDVFIDGLDYAEQAAEGASLWKKDLM